MAFIVGDGVSFLTGFEANTNLRVVFYVFGVIEAGS